MTTPQDAVNALFAMADDGRLQAACDRHGIHLMVVFGSAVDPNWPVPANDLDLAVLADRPTGPWGWGGLVTALSDLLDLDEIDVMDLSRAGIVARAEALSRGIPVFERVDGEFAERQMVAISQLMDTQWLRDLELELLAEG